MEGPDIANNPNNNQQSFQDKASMEGVAPQAQSASDQHDQSFHQEASPERRKDGERMMSSRR
jgi:hypothetical protein